MTCEADAGRRTTEPEPADRELSVPDGRSSSTSCWRSTIGATRSARRPNTCRCTTPSWPIWNVRRGRFWKRTTCVSTRSDSARWDRWANWARPRIPVFAASRRERPALSQRPAARRGILQLGKPRRTSEPQTTASRRDPAARPRGTASALTRAGARNQIRNFEIRNKFKTENPSVQDEPMPRWRPSVSFAVCRDFFR